MVHGENSFRDAACGISVRIAVAFVYCALEDTLIPSVIEISVERDSIRIAIGEPMDPQGPKIK